jgi:hypothetical protein
MFSIVPSKNVSIVITVSSFLLYHYKLQPKLGFANRKGKNNKNTVPDLDDKLLRKLTQSEFCS